jgi:hypothetical protein
MNNFHEPHKEEGGYSLWKLDGPGKSVMGSIER